MNGVNVVVKEDKSVERKLLKTANQLKKKYKGKTRKVNEQILKPKKPLQKAISLVTDTIIVFVVIVCGLLCFTNINSRFQGMPPSFAGYSAMQVVSGSMRKSGFEIGDVVMIRSVNTDTLKEGDMIAFYVYAQSFRYFKKNQCITVDTSDIGELEYKTDVAGFFGFQNESIKTASQHRSKLVFHHIKYVLEDKNGVRWFKTYGSSNPTLDSWFIREDLVVGAYDDSKIAQNMAVVLGKFSSSWTMIGCILVPLVLVAFSVIKSCMVNVQLALLECEVLEGKRKLTDKVCLENNIGYNMSKKTKYKVLAMASQNKKLEYVSLLWKNGSAPSEIKKYYLRKGLVLRPLEEVNKLHAECETMFNNHESDIKIAKYYHKRMDEIEAKQDRYKKIFKQLRKKMKDMNKETEEILEQATDSKVDKKGKEIKNTTLAVGKKGKVKSKAVKSNKTSK